MKHPKVSIIIATFNAAKTLSVALDSVLNQTFQDWECIIVDGASKDNTIEIVKSYIKRDFRFRCVSEPDKGIYDAFNKGWKNAKGEWIYYLGADDELLPNAIFKIDHLFKLDVDVVYGNIVYKTNKLLHKTSPKDVSIIKRHMLCSHQAIFMKQSVINKLKGFDLQYKISADFDLVLRAYLNNYNFKYVDQYIAIFDGGGISRGMKKLKEAYYLRKNNASISTIENLFILGKAILKNYIKHLFNIIWK